MNSELQILNGPEPQLIAFKLRYQTGMTLIEIMIALLIGAFLLGGVIQIFIGTKQTNRMQENLSRLQENGRFAMDFISKDIRMAGYWGCLNPLVGVANTDVDGTNDNAAGTADNIQDGTDTITIRGAFDSSKTTLPTNTTPPTKTCGDSVDITAAYYTDTSSKITYKIDGGVLMKDTNATAPKTTDPYPLIEDIENMQILYGADTDTPADATPNYYVPAGTVGLDMSKVVSVRISLSVVTHDDHLAAVARTNGDHKIGRTFTSTIALRNRLP